MLATYNAHKFNTLPFENYFCFTFELIRVLYSVMYPVTMETTEKVLNTTMPLCYEYKFKLLSNFEKNEVKVFYILLVPMAMEVILEI